MQGEPVHVWHLAGLRHATRVDMLKNYRSELLVGQPHWLVETGTSVDAFAELQAGPRALTYEELHISELRQIAQASLRAAIPDTKDDLLQHLVAAARWRPPLLALQPIDSLEEAFDLVKGVASSIYEHNPSQGALCIEHLRALFQQQLRTMHIECIREPTLTNPAAAHLTCHIPDFVLRIPPPAPGGPPRGVIVQLAGGSYFRSARGGRNDAFFLKLAQARAQAETLVSMEKAEEHARIECRLLRAALGWDALGWIVFAFCDGKIDWRSGAAVQGPEPGNPQPAVPWAGVLEAAADAAPPFPRCVSCGRRAIVQEPMAGMRCFDCRTLP